MKRNKRTIAYFAAVLLFVNALAFSHAVNSMFFYLAEGIAFIYILLAPGMLALPFLTRRKLPFMLGIALSAALSIFLLMISGLIINTLLPFVGIASPLSLAPLIITFDLLVLSLLVLHALTEPGLPLQKVYFSKASIITAAVATALPALACLGAISVNNGGSNILSMLCIAAIFVLLPIIVSKEKRLDESVLPFSLYMMALALLLMNSMRGWFVTGHDILLEYHVFTLTNHADLWNMAIFRDPYNACLSLTILPTYIQSLLHIPEAYVFKLLFQCIGAFPVVMLYYITRRYSTVRMAFLAGFMYISFPSFMVDMAFLNRQGIAFLFFAAIIYVMVSPEYFAGRARSLLLFIFGTGMIVSHYSTSYVAIALFAIAYMVNKVLRFLATRQRPLWFFRLTEKLGNKEIYQTPVRLSLAFVVTLVGVLLLWSTVITKTSGSFFITLKQIVANLQHPLGFDEHSGPAKYSLLQSEQADPAELFQIFQKKSLKDARTPASNFSNLFPVELAEKYPSFPVAPVNEPLIPITTVGSSIQSTLHISLAKFFYSFKQIYAKLMQIFLLVGFIGLAIGYGLRKRVMIKPPAEMIALSIAGLAVMVGQTVLPASAIDYGLLRLFQQNLIFLALPITLGLSWLISLIVRNVRAQIFVHMGVLLFSFIILSGFLPQLLGGGRPALPLNNYGFYYDAYYTHTEEIGAIDWLSRVRDEKLTIQSDYYFSSVKMLAYANTSPQTGLLSETIQRNSYVYLNYDNVKSSNVIEFINGDVFYYHLSTAFLEDNKNLIYNNGGSNIYR